MKYALHEVLDKNLFFHDPIPELLIIKQDVATVAANYLECIENIYLSDSQDPNSSFPETFESCKVRIDNLHQSNM